MNKYEKVFIYFDTNALECRHSGNSLFLSQFKVNTLYYDVEQLIHDYNLSESVEMCIPEIVWLELEEHLINHFSTEKKSMEAKLTSYKQSFGDLIDISYEFKDCNEIDEFKAHLNRIMTDFLKNPKVTAKIIPYPKDENALNRIVKQAIRSMKPFRTVKNGSKEYTDAGFKDALIYNTIVNHTGKNLGILVTQDNDFKNLFVQESVENLKLCTNFEDIKEILSSELDIITDKTIETILNSDEYLIHKIFSDSGLDENATYQIQDVNIKETTEEGTRADFIALVDGELYSFEVLYNIPANELIESTCEEREK